MPHGCQWPARLRIWQLGGLVGRPPRRYLAVSRETADCSIGARSHKATGHLFALRPPPATQQCSARSGRALTARTRRALNTMHQGTHEWGRRSSARRLRRVLDRGRARGRRAACARPQPLFSASSPGRRMGCQDGTATSRQHDARTTAARPEDTDALERRGGVRTARCPRHASVRKRGTVPGAEPETRRRLSRPRRCDGGGGSPPTAPPPGPYVGRRSLAFRARGGEARHDVST